MVGSTSFETLNSASASSDCVVPGRLMTEFQESGDLSVLQKTLSMGSSEALDVIRRSHVRGRGGAGFPAAHKWALLAEAASTDRVFICNALFPPLADAKEAWLMRTNPSKVLEAISIAAAVTGAKRSFLVLPESTLFPREEYERLLTRFDEACLAMDGDLAIGPRCELIYVPFSPVVGEETAILEYIEGRTPQPRGKPPLPIDQGLWGLPTVISSLETVLQCRYALKVGADEYKSVGCSASPGTAIFSLRGAFTRTGLFELPLGISLSDVIGLHGQGSNDGLQLLGVLPGGYTSPILTPNEFATLLDYDSLRSIGSDLGKGELVAVSGSVDPVAFGLHLSKVLNDASCGKCLPCKDGTARIANMLNSLGTLNTPSVDISARILPESKRHNPLVVLNNTPSGISYTDSFQGLDKLTRLCEFFKHRGDCDFSRAAASALLKFVTAFHDSFETALNSEGMAISL